MTVKSTDEQGNTIIWNERNQRYEYPDGTPHIHGKRICPKCNKPSLDINGVTDADFCLQGLTNCDFIDYACCGHGDGSKAYISLKDGRVFYLTYDYGKKSKK